MTTTEQRATTARGRAASPPRDAGPVAAMRAIEMNSIRLNLPLGIGFVTLPAPQRLAWYGGLAAIAAFGLIDWPIAAVLALGHLLSEDHHNQILRDFGEALEEV